MRGEQEQQLADAVGQLARGIGGVIVIDGQAGVGKTTLIRHAIEQAVGSGVHALYGRGEEVELARPLRPIIEALRGDPATAPLAARLIDGPWATAGRAVNEAGMIVADQLVAAIDALAAVRPMVLALDDLHWADPLTIASLTATLRRLPGTACLVLVAVRDASAVAGIIDLADVVVRLEPLTSGEVEAIVVEELGPIPAERIEAFIKECDGSPLLLDRSLRYWSTGGGVDLSVPVETRDLLRVASLLGQRFTVSELSALAGLSATRAVMLLAPALDARIVSDDGDALRFSHPTDREDFELQLPATARRAMRLHVAHVIDQLDGDPGRVLSHLLAAEVLPPREARWIVGVARRQAGVAPAAAAGLFAAAARSITDPVERDRLDADLAEALWHAGRREEAMEHAGFALPRCADFESSLRLRSVRYMIHDREGRSDLRLGLIDEELATAPTVALRRWLLAKRAGALMLLGRIRDANDAAAEACELAAPDGDDVAEILGRTTLGWTAMAFGQPAEGVAHLRRAMGTQDRLGRRVDPVELYLGVSLLEVDEFDEAIAMLRTGRERDLASGDMEGVTTYHWAMAGASLFAGQIDSAEVEARTGLGLAEESSTYTGMLFGYGFLALSLLQQDDIDGARAAVDGGAAWLAAHGPGIGWDFYEWAVALLQAHDGDVQGGFSRLFDVWTLMEEARYFLSWRMMLPDVVRMAVEAGDFERADIVLKAAELGATMAGPSIVSTRAAVLRCRAWIESDPALALEAAELLRSTPRRLEESEAIEQADRIAASLRSGGSTVGAARPRDPNTLTPAELRVVREVARGATNREVAEALVVSRHTVESHLKRIFVKLGIRSRTELVALAIGGAISGSVAPDRAT